MLLAFLTGKTLIQAGFYLCHQKSRFSELFQKWCPYADLHCGDAQVTDAWIQSYFSISNTLNSHRRPFKINTQHTEATCFSTKV